MFPCSFMADTELFACLRNNSIIEIWQNDITFKKFRDKIRNNICKDCKYERLCQGGCLFIPDINLCKTNE